MRKGQTRTRIGNDSLEQTWEKFAPCLVKPRLDALYGGCHDYFRAEAAPMIHRPDGKEIMSKGNLNYKLREIYRITLQLLRFSKNE